MDSEPSRPPPIHGAWYPRPRDPGGDVAFYFSAILWMLFAPAPAFAIFGLAIALPVVEAIMALWGALVVYCVVLVVLLVLRKRSVLLKRLTLAAMVLAGLPLAGAAGFVVWALASA
ncbi:MAG: hypothetical protein ACOVNS_05995 [Erythrobacter sp.]|jgi:hypothetical protein